ncbi:hypothetical protein [Streptomyces sp. NBC_00344]|uniref:hypothetical protein n=1 Tax=Streptomyces sp. NBC_00344 TaxID=2975720 RepID=UPI002E1A959F
MVRRPGGAQPLRVVAPRVRVFRAARLTPPMAAPDPDPVRPGFPCGTPVAAAPLGSAAVLVLH